MGYSETIGKASQLDQMTTANAQSNAKAAAYLKQLLSAADAQKKVAEYNSKLQEAYGKGINEGTYIGANQALSKVWENIG